MEENELKVPLNVVISAGVREKLKADSKASGVPQGVLVERALTGESKGEDVLEELLDLVRSLPDRAEIKAVVIEAGEELRAARQPIAREPSRYDGTISRALTPLPEGVSVGLPAPNAYCVHCETKFSGAKGATMCGKCGKDGHVNSGDCRRCAQLAHARSLASSSTAGEGVDYDWQDPT